MLGGVDEDVGEDAVGLDLVKMLKWRSQRLLLCLDLAFDVGRWIWGVQKEQDVHGVIYAWGARGLQM